MIEQNGFVYKETAPFILPVLASNYSAVTLNNGQCVVLSLQVIFEFSMVTFYCLSGSAVHAGRESVGHIPISLRPWKILSFVLRLSISFLQ